ncbi:MAG: metal-sensing transcriptional repressor [Oscillospiraceae bacterium]
MKADQVKTARLIKTARGQLDGILKMIDDDRYCVDIVNQLMATQSILRRASRDILAAHMECCVREALEEGGGQEKIDELVGIFDQLIK